MSELHLDEQTLTRAKQLAEAKHVSVEELISQAIDRLANDPQGFQQRVDPIGAFEDCAELLDDIVKEAYQNRERLLLRTRVYQAVVLLMSLTPLVAGMACGDEPAPARFLFTSQGKTGLATTAGEEVRYLPFDRPGQATWQPGPFLSDGRHVVVLSMEPRRDGPGRPFEQFYTQTPTHLWLYDLAAGELEEIATKDRLAPFETPQLLVGDRRLLVQVVRDGVGQVFSMNLDGSDPREFTRAGEGLPYGLSLRPDGRRVAFHLASPEGYQIWTSNIDGSERTRIVGDPAHLYFGPVWSPDGEWIAYVDCLYGQDPGHDWCDVCVARPDGSERHVLTTGQAMWFAASYGNEKARGGGSNLVAWTHDGKILFPRRTPDARLPWPYQTERPDVDHFNREYRPQEARGGTEICRLDPRDGSIEVLTKSDPLAWDFRVSESPNGQQLVFCRAATGELPAIWVADRDGGHARVMTRGIDELGADHPRWIPMPSK
ncbi:MAG: PD40 domain-containing protein [Pirellulales bacterium]|nr:PD40 domain-containing protein [Pirellulales bacterium]